MDPTAGVNASTGYWVAIARDANFTTVVQAAFTDEPCYAPRSPLVDEGTLYYWQVIPAVSNAFDYTGPAGSLGGFTASPSFQHASVPPTPIRPWAGRRPRAPVVFQWSPVPEQVRDYTIEVAAGRLVQLDPRVGDHRRHLVFGVHDLPGRHDVVLARARQQRRQPGARLVGRRRPSCRRCPCRRSRPPQPFSGRHVPGAHLDAGRRRHGLRGAERLARRRASPTTTVPSTAASYTKMTGTGHGTVQVRAVFGQTSRAPTRRRATSCTRSASRGGAKTQLINKQRKRALTFAWNTKTNAKQYKVQVSRTPGFTQPFLDDTTDQASYTPLLTQQDFIDGGAHVLARRGGRPRRQRRRVHASRRSSRCWRACRCSSAASRRTASAAS